MVRKANQFRNFLVLLVLLVPSLFLVGCTSVVFWPRVEKVKFYDPVRMELKHEDIEFQDEEGNRLHGWWFPATTEKSKGTLVYFHGNGENLTTHFLNFVWLPEEGYNFFIFDYPGYGVSQGEATIRNAVLSGRAALRWVHSNKDPRPLIVFAQSLGGNIGFRSFLDTKNEIPYRNLILSETFLSIKSIGRKKLSEMWFTWPLQPLGWLLLGDAYSPQNIERRAPVPLLVIHGQEDRVVNPEYGDEIFAKSPEPKEMWKVPGGQHGDLFWRHGFSYRKKFVDYLNRFD